MNAPIKPNCKIEFHKALAGDAQAYWLTIGMTQLFISYETIMAFSGILNGESVCFRRKDTRSSTTARHMSKCHLGPYEQLDDSSFCNKLEAALLEGIHPILATVKEMTS